MFLLECSKRKGRWEKIFKEKKKKTEITKEGNGGGWARRGKNVDILVPDPVLNTWARLTLSSPLEEGN